MKLWLVDRDNAHVLGTLPLSSLWQEEAQKIADECAAFITAVMGNEAGEFRPAQSVNEPAKEERP